MQRSRESVPAIPASESRDIRGGAAHWPASLVPTANYSFTDFVSTNRVSSKSGRHDPLFWPLHRHTYPHIHAHIQSTHGIREEEEENSKWEIRKNSKRIRQMSFSFNLGNYLVSTTWF